MENDYFVILLFTFEMPVLARQESKHVNSDKILTFQVKLGNRQTCLVIYITHGFSKFVFTANVDFFQVYCTVTKCTKGWKCMFTLHIKLASRLLQRYTNTAILIGQLLLAQHITLLLQQKLAYTRLRLRTLKLSKLI